MNDENHGNNSLILHIGIQKTGSTFLQYDVFRKMSIDYINFKYMIRKKQHPIIEQIKDLSISRNNLEKTTPISNRPILISNENIYCDDMSYTDNRFKYLDRLAYVFPDAKIIFGIRNKESLLISFYKQYVALGGVYSFNRFKKEIFNTEKLEYEPYMDELFKRYGKENVFIYQFEDLMRNRDNIITKMAEFIGVKKPEYHAKRHNVGYGANQLKIALFLNRLFKTPYNPSGLIPYPYNVFFLPQRYVFQRLLGWVPRKKVTIDLLSNGLKGL